MSPCFNAAHFGDHNQHAAVLERIAVDHALGDVGAQCENVLNLFGRNVFALRQLEDVLAAVNDLDGAVRIHHGDVASHEPTLLVERLGGLDGALVVPREYSGALHAQFAAGVRLVSVQVVHFGEVLQPPLNALEWAAHVSCDGVLSPGQTGGSRDLGEAIAFEDGAAEADLEELEHLSVDGGRASDHVANFAAEHVANLSEHELVVAARRIRSICAQTINLRGERFVGQPGLASTSRVNLALKGTVDLVVKTGHGGEKGRLELLAVSSKLRGIAREVANACALQKAITSHHLLKRVGIRQVADHFDIAAANHFARNGMSRSHEVCVSKLHALRVARGSRSVAENGAVVLPALFKGSRTGLAGSDNRIEFVHGDANGGRRLDLLRRAFVEGDHMLDGVCKTLLLHGDEFGYVLGRAEDAGELGLV